MFVLDFLRSLFCKHDFVLIGYVKQYESDEKEIPCSARKTFLCQKCGRVIKVKL